MSQLLSNGQNVDAVIDQLLPNIDMYHCGNISLCDFFDESDYQLICTRAAERNITFDAIY